MFAVDARRVVLAVDADAATVVLPSDADAESAAGDLRVVPAFIRMSMTLTTYAIDENDFILIQPEIDIESNLTPTLE